MASRFNLKLTANSLATPSDHNPDRAVKVSFGVGKNTEDEKHQYNASVATCT